MPTPIVFENVAPVVPVRATCRQPWSDTVNSASTCGLTITILGTALPSGEQYQFT